MPDATDHYAAAVRHLSASEYERTTTDTERRQNHLSAAATHASLAATVIAERQAAAAEQSVAVNVRLLEVMAGPAPQAEAEELAQLRAARDRTLLHMNNSLGAGYQQVETARVIELLALDQAADHG